MFFTCSVEPSCKSTNAKRVFIASNDGKYSSTEAKQVASTLDPEIHYGYIEAAAKSNNIQEVERMTRESTAYDAARVRDLLMELKLADPRPLIYNYIRKERRSVAASPVPLFIIIYEKREGADRGVSIIQCKFSITQHIV